MASKKAKDTFGSMLCVGTGFFLLFHTIENIGMCLALIPVVGITLPFMSAGGSSMLATYVLLGLVHSVRAYENKFYFRRGI